MTSSIDSRPKRTPLRLFSGPLSMFKAKAQIAVLEKGLACEVVMVPFDMDRLYEPKHREVMQINPKRQVPVLIHGDLEIFDSTQIFEYLEDLKPSPALWPESPVERARARLLELKSEPGHLKRLIADRATTPTTFVMISRQAGPSPSSPVGVRASARSNMKGVSRPLARRGGILPLEGFRARGHSLRQTRGQLRLCRRPRCCYRLLVLRVGVFEQFPQLEKAMAVKRIVTNIASAQVDAARSFYGNVLGLEVVMELGWILTFAAPDAAAVPQISIASEGGSGTPVPDISVEVDDLDEVYQRVATAGLPIEYGPTQEPWGVRRFYVRDPFGRLVNILTHP